MSTDVSRKSVETEPRPRKTSPARSVGAQVLKRACPAPRYVLGLTLRAAHCAGGPRVHGGLGHVRCAPRPSPLPTPLPLSHALPPPTAHASPWARRCPPPPRSVWRTGVLEGPPRLHLPDSRIVLRRFLRRHCQPPHGARARWHMSHAPSAPQNDMSDESVAGPRGCLFFLALAFVVRRCSRTARGCGRARAAGHAAA